MNKFKRDFIATYLAEFGDMTEQHKYERAQQEWKSFQFKMERLKEQKRKAKEVASGKSKTT